MDTICLKAGYLEVILHTSLLSLSKACKDPSLPSHRVASCCLPPQPQSPAPFPLNVFTSILAGPLASFLVLLESVLQVAATWSLKNVNPILPQILW